MSIKNSSDTTGNRTRDLSTCSVVPQPAVPLHVPFEQFMPEVIPSHERHKNSGQVLAIDI